MADTQSYACDTSIFADPSDRCSTITLPVVSFADCPADYAAHESEICDVWIVPADDGVSTEIPTLAADGGADPDAWHNPLNYPTESGHFSNAGTGMRHLIVIGDKPISEITEVTVAKRWSLITNRGHIVNIDVTDMSIPNYDFIRALQFQPTVAIWYRDIDGYMYGGANGIVCDIQNAGNIANRGEGGLLTGQVIFNWNKECDPPAAVESATP